MSFSGKWFNAVHYGVGQQTEDIDYDQVAALARAPAQDHPRRRQCDPRLIDSSSAPRRRGRRIFWVDAAHFIGLVAGKAIPSPVPYRTSSPSRPTRCCAARARRSDLQGGARDGARQGGLPDDAGWPADAHHRGQGGQLQGVRDPRVRRLRAARSSPTRSSWRPRWGVAASARPPAAPTPTSRCTTSRGSASPASRPRRGPTPRGSSSTRTPSPSTRRSPTSRRASVSAPRARPRRDGHRGDEGDRRADRHGGHQGRSRPQPPRVAAGAPR